MSLEDSEATFQIEESKSKNELEHTIAELIEDLGYDVGTPNIASDHPSSVVADHAGCIAVTVSISGMTCSHCTNTITKALQALDTVQPGSVQVSLELEQATFKINSTMTKEAIKEIIEDLGYDVGQVHFDTDKSEPMDDNYQTAVFSLSGMTCQHCVQTVTDTISNIPGVVPHTVHVDLEKQQGTFSFSGNRIDSNTIKEVIEGLGYDLNGKPRISQGLREHALDIPSSYTSQLTIPMNEHTPLIPNKVGKRKIVMRVLGMTCQSCVASVTDALTHEIPDVQPGSVRVNLQTEMAMFICSDPDIDFIHTVIEERGFTVENIQIIHNLVPPLVLLNNEPYDERVHRQNSVVSLGAISVDSQHVSVPNKVTFRITGMTCASCVRTIERGLVKLPGVDPTSVQVNLLTQSGTLAVRGGLLDAQTITDAVKKMGYTASQVVFISGPSPQETTHTITGYKADMIITHMYCANCVEKVHTALVKLHGIRSKTIQVDLQSGRASFEFTGEFITRQRIHQSILQLGLSAESIKITKFTTKAMDSDRVSMTSQKSNRLVTTHLVVTGMTCSSCVANIERTMMKQSGVMSCQVNLLSKSAVIEHDPSIIGARSLAHLIEQIGYKAELAQDTQGNTISEQRASMRQVMDQELDMLKKRFLWSLLFAIPVVLISMIFMMALPDTNPVHQFFMQYITHGLTVADLILFLLSTPVQFWLGLPFYQKAYKSLVYSRTANMETLVAMGTTVAYVASVASVIAAMARPMAGAMSLNYFETSVLLITFIHFGKWLEALAKGKTAETITKLMDLQPETATLVTVENDAILSEKEIASQDIQGKNNMNVCSHPILTPLFFFTYSG